MMNSPEVITERATVHSLEALNYFLLNGWSVVSFDAENGLWKLERPTLKKVEPDEREET